MTSHEWFSYLHTLNLFIKLRRGGALLEMEIHWFGVIGRGTCNLCGVEVKDEIHSEFHLELVGIGVAASTPFHRASI